MVSLNWESTKAEFLLATENDIGRYFDSITTCFKRMSGAKRALSSSVIESLWPTPRCEFTGLEYAWQYLHGPEMRVPWLVRYFVRTDI